MPKSADTATPTTETDEEKQKRTRKPSEFKQTTRVNLMLHKGVTANDAASPDAQGQAIAALFGEDVATRIVLRTREVKGEDGKPVEKKTGIRNVTVYVAPKGFEFPDDKVTGTRLDPTTWEKLQARMVAAGFEPTPANIDAFLIATLGGDNS